MTSGRYPASRKRVGAAVDTDEHRLEVPDVAANDPQVVLVPRAARDDQDMAVSESGLQHGELDSLREQAALVPQIPHRVVGEARDRLRQTRLLLVQRMDELELVEHPALGQAIRRSGGWSHRAP